MEEPIDITFAIKPRVSSVTGNPVSEWEFIIDFRSQDRGWDPETIFILPALTAEQMIGFLAPDSARPQLNSVAELLRYLSGHMRGSNGTTIAPPPAALVEFGKKLLDNSFAKHLRWPKVQKLRKGSQALRFTLQWHSIAGSASEAWQLIREIPWELLHDEYDFLFRAVPSVHLVEQRPSDDLTHMRNRRALILTVADAPGSGGALEPQRVEEFSAKLREQLLRSGYSPKILSDRSAEQVKEEFARNSFQLFFAICHGEPAPADAGILKCANGSLLTGKDLATAITTGPGKGAALELAVLAACWSGSAAQSPLSGMAQHLIHAEAAQFVAAFTTEVSAPFALALTDILFSWMRRGQPKELAFHEARLSLKNSQEWWTARLFVGSRVPRTERVNSRPLIPAASRQFVGRRQELDGLLDWLRRLEDPGLCVLSGPSGSGKTELALQTIEQFWPRVRDRPVVWVDMQRELLLEAQDHPEVLLLRQLRFDLVSPQLASSDKQKTPDDEKPAEVQNQLEAAISDSLKEGASSGKPMVLVIDGWPSDASLPAVLCRRMWKVLLTTTGPTVCLSATAQQGSQFTDMLKLELSPLCWEQAQQLLHEDQRGLLTNERPSFWPLELLLLQAALSRATNGVKEEWLYQLASSDYPMALPNRRTRMLIEHLLRHLSPSELMLLQACVRGILSKLPGDATLQDDRELNALAATGLIVYDDLLMRYHVPSAIRGSLLADGMSS